METNTSNKQLHRPYTGNYNELENEQSNECNEHDASQVSSSLFTKQNVETNTSNKQLHRPYIQEIIMN